MTLVAQVVDDGNIGGNGKSWIPEDGNMLAICVGT